jgi:ABC-type transport system involved in multi-copper enzyme maturation permease subunit
MGLHFRIALRLGLRSQGLWGLAGLGVLSLGLVGAISRLSARQPGTVALDMGLSAIHALGILLTLWWAHELFCRDSDHDRLPVLLAYPLPRSSYLLGRFGGLALLLALGLALLGPMLVGLVLWAQGDFGAQSPLRVGWPLAVTLVGVWVELLVVGAFAWLISTLTITPFLPFLAGLAFAWSARSLGPVMSHLGPSEPGQPDTSSSPWLPVLEGLHRILPDLSRLDWREMALYGEAAPWPVMLGHVGSAAGYVALFLGLALWAFERRDIG